MTKREGMKTPVSSSRVDGGKAGLYRLLSLFGSSRNFDQLLAHLIKKKFYKKSQSGVILIIMAVVIPVLLLGTKYILDLRTLHKVQLEKENGGWYKRCAKEAALAVAKKWNPGLTLFQQRDAMYKIADDVYNSSPLTNDSVVARAIPRLDLSGKITVKNEGGFNPIQMKSSDYQSKILDKSLRTVEYQEEINNYIRGIPEVKKRNLVYPISILFNSFYNFSNRDSALVLKDTVTEYTVIHDNTSYHYPRYLIRVSNNDALRSSGISYAGIPGTPKETINATVEKRKNLDNDKVKIEIENDKIKVTTDGNYVGYAVPAECNVDIVLGIPVNGAANNADNLDNNTPTTGSPYVCNSEYLQEDGLKTPMSQIGQAFHDFVKNNFHYTRGVNIGIVPYCGMVSLPLDRIGAEYATDPSKVWAVDPENFDRTVFPGNQNTYQGYIRPCMLYGLFGGKGDISKFRSHYGVSYSWTNVMVPQGIVKRVPEYGDNLIYYGDILSTNDPAGNVKNYTEYSYSPKFMRRPTYKIPAFPGRFNFLSMDFESLDGHNYVWCNPYHIVEMQSDLLKITDLLNLFYPFNFSSNGLSNFIFVPFVWANNLFQSWSKDPKYDAVDTTNATPSTMTNETSGRLSAPSKGDKNSGRKKALILVVNKPDWFEPGELTYLGFDNDYSEIPMIESDCIRGDIDYSDTTKYFADGTKYDGTVQGAKKILKLTGFTRNSTTGHYECDSGVATLTFPQKYLVKVVVEGKITWTNAGRQYEHPENNARWGNIAWDGTKFLTGTSDSSGKVITSTDGETWTATPITHTRNPTNPEIDMVVRPAYGDGMWQAIGRGTSSGLNSASYSYVSYDGIDWIQIATSWACDAQAYGNGGFMHFGLASSTRCKAYWLDPSDTTKVLTNGDFSKIENNHHRALGFCNGKWCAITWDGRFITSYDNGVTWAVESLSGASPGEVTGTQTEWYGPIYGFGRYWAICRGDGNGTNSSNNYGNTGINCSRIVFSRDGKIWYKDNAALGTLCGTTRWFRGLGFNGKRFVSASDDGYFAYGDCNATIRFTNITSNETHCTQAGKEYKVTEKKEFFIEPDQISDPQTEGGEYSITFDATNLRLISAEITNRPYTRVTPTVSKSGNSFVLNAKVPFVVPLRVTGSNATLTYANEANVSVTQRFLHSQSFQITPGTHRYEKTFDVNNDCPSYKVTLTPTNLTIGLPQVGTIEVKKASKTGLSLDSKTPSNGSFSDDDGVTFGYETTVSDDVNETQIPTATTEGSVGIVYNRDRDGSNGSGTITCPTGAVLHVKAVPYGSVTFYNPNDLGETDITGATITSFGVTATSGLPLTITGKQIFTFPASCFDKKYPYKSVPSWSDSKIEFSPNKLKFSLYNANILYAVLNNQMLRSDGVRRKDNELKVHFHDPSLMYDFGGTANTGSAHYFKYVRQGGSGKFYMINPWFRNIKIKSGIGTENSSSGDGVTFTLSYFPTDGNKTSLELTKLAQNELVYDGVINSSDNVIIQYSAAGRGIYTRYLQITNKNPCIMNMSNTADTTTGLWITDGNLINFEGQGDLEVIASPYGTIKFGNSTYPCSGEENMTHELYKTYNFCLEPSQMTNNGNGTQSVTFTTTGYVTVTATYEIKQRTQITVTKPNNVSFATINVTGHKKEMEWETASGLLEDSTLVHRGAAQKLKFDGKRCYFGSINGDIMCSNDFGKTWYALNNTRPYPHDKWMFTIGPMGLYYVRADTGVIYYSTEAGKTWANTSFINTGDWWDAFTYSFDADNTNAKAMAVRADGQIKTSSDCITWVDKASLPSNSQEYYFGHLYYNGKWIVRSRSNPVLIYQSTDGSGWTEIGQFQSENGIVPELYLTYGSNLIMAFSNQSVDKLYTTTNLSSFVTHNVPHIVGSISYANGNFIASTRNSPIQFAYGTYHDGVMWRENSNNSGAKEKIGISQDIDQNISEVINTEEYSNTVYGTNMTITDISVTYDKVVPLNPSTVIEYKKIRLPKMSRYIDYSKNPLEFKGTSTLDTFSNWWGYNSGNGYWTNITNEGWNSVLNVENFTGDYTSIGYSDEPYWADHYYKNGMYDNDLGPYDSILTSGLNRFYTSWENKPKSVYARTPGFMWSHYTNIIMGSLYWIMGTMTLSINAALWAGAEGDSLHEHHWQGDGSGNEVYDQDENGVWVLRDATSALKLVTKDAYVKLKSNWGNNLRVYIIKYRKQTQYKHPVTGNPVDFDYDYLDDCASLRNTDSVYDDEITDAEEVQKNKYIYDISADTASDAKEKLDNALKAIAKDIRKWAGYEEARNVD